MSNFRRNVPAHRAPGTAAAHALARRQLKAYQDNELRGLRQWMLVGHIARCPECRNEVTELKRVSDSMKNMPRATPRPELRARILASLPDAPPQRARQRLTVTNATPVMRLSFAGAMCGLLLISVWAVGRNRAAVIVNHDGSQSPASSLPGSSFAASSNSGNRTGRELTAMQHGRSGNGQASINSYPMPQYTMDPQSDQAMYTDPDSRKAQEIINTHLDDLDRAVKLARQARQEFELRQRQADAINLKEPPVKPSVSPKTLQLAVADLPTAQDRLRSVVQHLGGNMTDVATAQPTPEPATTFDPNAGANGAGSPAMASTIAIRIPASEVSHFVNSLREIGAVSPVKSASTAFGQQTPRDQSVITGAIAKNRKTEPFRESEMRQGSIPFKMPYIAPVPMSEHMTNSTVLFTIQIRQGVQEAH